jgi:L-rhamnose-H+ transport protein
MVFGALIPSIYYQFDPQAGKDTIGLIAGSTWGLTILLGLVICILGIVLCGRAGTMKEKQLKANDPLRNFPDNGKDTPANKLKQVKLKPAVAGGQYQETYESVGAVEEAGLTGHGAPAGTAIEYKFALGLTLAIISGVLSACFNFGLEAGKPMADVANNIWKAANPGEGEFLFSNNVVFVVVLWGGLTTNFIWCMILNARNKTFKDYTNKSTPLISNYLFAALAGTTWFLQFFFYGMGASKLGNGASSWILHMSFIILVANIWGFVSKEWKGVSTKTRNTIIAGVVVIILSVLIVGYGNYLHDQSLNK